MNLQCKMCGGNVEVMPGNKQVGTCRFCGSTMTLPKLDGDADAAAFNYANELRRQCDFDSAISAYRDILARDHTNAEAYWGICLSRYGVEYVQDPKSQKRLPTLHRLNFKRVADDTDYRFALQYAENETACQIYRDEAARIDQIRTDALKLVNNEPPYDVFICYKEREEGGGLTEDYGLAQSIYNKLDKLGYRVFFAHITLLGKLGEAYEPCIYAALNSSKVMLVVTTKPEHVNAIWVRNEWSRYLAITEEDPRKRLVVCTRGMNPYSLPEELKYLQAMNLADLNALESIVATVRQVVGMRGGDAGLARGMDYLHDVTKDNNLERIRHLLSQDKFDEAEQLAAPLEGGYAGNCLYWFYRAIASTRNFRPADMLSDTNGMKYLTRAKQLADSQPYSPESAWVLQACREAEAMLSACKQESATAQQLDDLSGAIEAHKQELSRHQEIVAALDLDIAAADKDQIEARQSQERIGSKIMGLRLMQFIRTLLLLACVAVFVFGWMSTKYGIFAAREMIAQWPEWCRPMALGLWDFILSQARGLGIPVGSFHILRPISCGIGILLLLRHLNRGKKIRELKRQRAEFEKAADRTEAQKKQLGDQRAEETEAVRQLENKIAQANSNIAELKKQTSQLHQAQKWTYKV